MASEWCTHSVSDGGLLHQGNYEDAYFGICSHCGGECWYEVWKANECKCLCCWTCQETKKFNSVTHKPFCGKTPEKLKSSSAPTTPRNRLLKIGSWGSGLLRKEN